MALTPTSPGRWLVMSMKKHEAPPPASRATADTRPQSMSSKAPFPPEVRELIASLKFHFRQTLTAMPLEIALLAMREAWKACNQEQDVPPPPPSLLR